MDSQYQTHLSLLADKIGVVQHSRTKCVLCGGLRGCYEWVKCGLLKKVFFGRLNTKLIFANHHLISCDYLVPKRGKRLNFVKKFHLMNNNLIPPLFFYTSVLLHRLDRIIYICILLLCKYNNYPLHLTASTH